MESSMINFSNLAKILKDKKVRLVFSLLIIIFIVIYLNQTGQDFSKIKNVQKPMYFVYATPIVLFSLFLHGFAWYKILVSLGSTISLSSSIYVYYLSSLGRYLPGSFWYIMFRTTIGKDLGVDTQKSILGVGIELLFTITTGLMLSILGISFQKITLLPEQIKLLFWFIGITLVVFGILFIATKVLHDQKDRSLLHEDFTTKIIRAVNYLRVMNKKDIFQILILFLMAWLTQGFAFYLTASAWLHIPISLLFTFITVYATGWIIGFINPLTPSGIGSRETIFLITLPKVLFPPIIIAVSLAMRLLGLFGEMFFAIFFWLILRKKNKKVFNNPV